MKISVIGGTGMIGSRIVAEAARRGHEVTAMSRSGTTVAGAARTRALELGETSEVSAIIEASDVTVIAVSPDRSGGSQEPTLQAHRDLIAAKPVGSVLVIGGAGSLVINGVQLKDSPEFPSALYSEASTFSTILELYRRSNNLSWTFLSPPPLIQPGERTGSYHVGTDSPVGEAISAEDFAVAVIDELEKPAHSKTRFTVAN